MSKYKILELNGLRELLEANREKIYSPEGYELIAFQNGIFGGQLLYDFKNEKAYGLCLKEVPLTEKDIQWLDGEYAQTRIRYNMNYKEAIDFLKSKGKWNKDEKN